MRTLPDLEKDFDYLHLIDYHAKKDHPANGRILIGYDEFGKPNKSTFHLTEKLDLEFSENKIVLITR